MSEFSAPLSEIRDQYYDPLVQEHARQFIDKLVEGRLKRWFGADGI